MISGVSSLSLVAASVYALVVFACGIAGLTATQHAQQKWHRIAWLLLFLLFVVLIALRVFGLEDWLRDSMRAAARASDNYGERRRIQRPVVAAVITLAAGSGFAWLYLLAKNGRGRRNIAAMLALAAGAAMVGLVALRIISLHFVDALLYGPLKLNWVGDLSLTAIIGGAALYYVGIVRTGRKKSGPRR